MSKWEQAVTNLNRLDKIIESKTIRIRYLRHALKHLVEGNIEWVWRPEEIFDLSANTFEDCIGAQCDK